MADLVVIVPSRGRPHAVAEMARAFQDTCSAYDVLLLFAVDNDDPALGGYIAAQVDASRRHWARTGVTTQAGGSMVAALNTVAARVLTDDEVDAKAIAFFGDDHRPRTENWDVRYLEALAARPGIVYGNDLIQGPNLPTQCAMSAELVRALGHMAPPTLTHLYVDNYWRDLGHEAGCLTYLPDVIVEHLHPVAGKASVDEGYRRVNAPAMYGRDRTAYATYVAEHWGRDVAAARSVLAGAAR